ncbi:hypothetical protein XHC_2908 [Xanthomonas hortorum pv. carotae str. M081]|nr:hypothetical protein XHC_2908 [Xanthomonas hortorum pv. carotae str. M081]
MAVAEASFQHHRDVVGDAFAEQERGHCADPVVKTRFYPAMLAGNPGGASWWRSESACRRETSKSHAAGQLAGATGANHGNQPAAIPTT